MTRAAAIARQAAAHGMQAAVPFLVTPGSARVRATLERDGQMRALTGIGAKVLASACGPCIGQWRREVADAPNTIVSSFNRNFRGRNDGRSATAHFIASPEIVTAFALAGRLSFDPRTDALQGAGGAFRLEPPGASPEVPARGFVRSREAYIPPLADDEAVELAIDPRSERLQALQPWPAWDGNDYLDMPVLLKARGKTTTDDISPAGPWLRLRGHLERFSDNLLLGAVNAYTTEVGRSRDLLGGGAVRTPAEVARAYRARGVRWLIVGDANYGEGSSREHAALSPRLLGGVAVIARSFARIHEANLKKQGLLALTFRDPADYERIREDDRVSLLGLSGMAPAEPVICHLSHCDGTHERLLLDHSFSASQLEWFRAGSALNRAAAQSSAASAVGDNSM